MKHYPVHPIKEGYVAVPSRLVYVHADGKDCCIFCYSFGERKRYVPAVAGGKKPTLLQCGKAICPDGRFMVPAELAVQWQFDNADRN